MGHAAKEPIDEKKLEKNLRLNFMTKDRLVMTEFCKLILLPKEVHFLAKFLVITSNLIKDKSPLEEKIKRDILTKVRRTTPRNRKKPITRINYSLEDIEIFRTIATFLRHHPEWDITSLKELALKFGTNEYKLKRGFREFFGMTVFQFLKNERLKNAHLSIRNTREQFKKIAQQNGFRNASHFTREFRARYGYTPTELRNNSN